MASASPYADSTVHRITEAVAASSTDHVLASAVSERRLRLVALALQAGGTATDVTIRSLSEDESDTEGDAILQEDDEELYLEDDTEVWLETASSVAAGALLLETNDEILLEDGTELLDESAGGLAILPTFALGNNGSLVLPFNPHGWAQTPIGYGLSVTTGTGSTVAVTATAVELSV